MDVPVHVQDYRVGYLADGRIHLLHLRSYRELCACNQKTNNEMDNPKRNHEDRPL